MKDFTTLSEDMLLRAYDGETVSSVLFYKEAQKLVRELLLYKEVELIDIELEEPALSNYNNEYYVTLCSYSDSDDQIDLFVQKSLCDGVYLDSCSDYIYIDGGANSRLLEYVDYKRYTELFIADNDEIEYVSYDDEEDIDLDIPDDNSDECCDEPSKIVFDYEIDEEGLAEYYRENDVYTAIFDLIEDVMMNAGYIFDDNNELVAVKIDTHSIFDAFRD